MAVLILKASLIVGVLMTAIAYAVLLERRVVAWIQGRLGPNRVGFGILATLPVVGPFLGFTRKFFALGLGHPIADGLKLFLKEDVEPAGADRWTYRLAPLLAVLPVITGFAVIPFGPDLEILGRTYAAQVSSLRFDILFLLAIGSLGSYSVILAGWSSNSKYSLLGALRAAAQIVSYELPLGIALLSAVLVAESMSLREIVASQAAGSWIVFWQPVAFLVVVASSIAEANRAPFDLPEAESELVAGYFTEYSGMRNALFFLGEYAHLFLSGSLVAVVFLGGADVPFLPPDLTPWPLGVLSFCAKVSGYIFFCMWIRSTWPRLRYDTLMHFSWKVLTPVATLNLVLTAFAKAVF